MEDSLDYQIGKCYFITSTDKCMDAINDQLKQD